MKKNNIYIFIIAGIIGIAIFWKSYILGLIPFPGDYLLSWYEPWRTYFTFHGVPILAHKAILDDVFRQLYQYKIIAAEAIRDGYLPLWNPHNGSGMPLMAVMHAGFLTPLMALFVTLPGWIAWTIYIAIQPIFLSIGMLWYGRKIGLSWVASIFIAVVYTTSGFITVRYLFGEYLYVAACLPLLLGVIELYKDNKKSKSIWSIPFIILFMMTSGQPQMILYVLIIFVAYALLRLKKTKTTYITIGSLCLIGFLLSAIQLIPTIELYKQANMISQASTFVIEKFLLSIFQFTSIIIPNYFGNPATYNYFGKGDYIETAVSIGSVAILLSGLSVLGKKNEIRNFFIVLIGLTLIVVLRSPLTEWLYTLPIPIISTGVPTRIFFLTTFSLSILSGFGLDYYLCNIHKQARAEKFWMGLVAITVLLFTVIGRFYVDSKWQMTAIRNSLLEAFVLAIAILILLALQNGIFKKYANFLIYLLIIFQLVVGLYNSMKFLPFSDRSTLFPDTKILNQIRTVSFFDRVMGLGSATLQTNIATALHLYDPNYYDPLYIKRYGEFVAYANSGSVQKILPRSDVLINDEISPPQDVIRRRERLFQLLSIRFILLHNKDTITAIQRPIVWSDDAWTIQKNFQALPRTYIVKQFEVVKNSNQLLTRLFDPLFDPTTSVLVEEDIPFTKTIDTQIKDNVTIVSYKSNRVEIEVSSSSSGILVLTDTYYQGWKAYIDSKETPIYRVNYSLRGIIVPEGNHLVQFIYKPFSVTLGIYVSLISGIFYISILIYMFRKKSVH